MKKLLALVICGLLLTGCSVDTEKSDYKENSIYFKTLSKESYGEIIYDTRTGVEYWISSCAYNYGNLTLLVDAEGKPLIYDRNEDKE